jgi:site-specific recombinase XerD
MDAQGFLTHISESKAKNTAKSYKNGLRHFAEWYQKKLHDRRAQRDSPRKSCFSKERGPRREAQIREAY